MISAIGVCVHILLRWHRPVWRWYAITDHLDWRACEVCQDKKK